MIDSNVLVSAVYNPNSKPAHALRHVCENHALLLCEYIIKECYGVIKEKFPQHEAVLDTLLASMNYELAAVSEGSTPVINPKDAPILNAAISADVDRIISGGKHFLALQMERPKVLTPAQYLEEQIAQNQ